jgi:hypothetical protein
MGRLADRHRDAFRQRHRIAGQYGKAASFLVKHLADRPMRLVRATEHTMEGAHVGRLVAAPGRGLSVEVVNIGEAAGDPPREQAGKEGVE